MTDSNAPDPARPRLLIARQPGDSYALMWVDPNADETFTPIATEPSATFPSDHSIMQVGRYLVHWGPIVGKDGDDAHYPYRMVDLDLASSDPLNGRTVMSGDWAKKKFWGTRADFGNPDGATKGFGSEDALFLTGLGNYVLNLIPTPGRGTFMLWDFDPAPAGGQDQNDPLPHPKTPMGAFDSIDLGHELIALGNIVLDWEPATGRYWTWSFDPQAPIPLSRPTLSQGTWATIDHDHRLIGLGDLVLDWNTVSGEYRLWAVDPYADDPLATVLATGTMPAGITADSSVNGFLPTTQIDPIRVNEPGTMDFLRSRVKHVVYYMLENRSPDHVLGWLYEHGDDGVHYIGGDHPYRGASTEMSNDAGGGRRTHLSVYQDGKLGGDYDLELLSEDPYHDHSDVMRQMFHTNPNGYLERATPDMDGFVWNNGTNQVMETYSPEQLPVLNGLARSFATCDEWFCSMPGGTDVNRAFSLTGSSELQLNNFQNGAEYLNWPNGVHRPPVWKTLWSNGFDNRDGNDWRIYNAIEWKNFVFTYHLFLQGHIDAVDEDVTNGGTTYVEGIDSFFTAAARGELPSFSFLEPIWVSLSGSSSYHPGGDLIPGEKQLEKIYEALRSGPSWDETLLVVTFDEHGGIFDHVPPPYAVNPWPNDVVDGFTFDLLGPRVPTILVSPLIAEHTVFRSTADTSYDSTSILATLLSWFGVPTPQWGLGERTRMAPTFEGVLTCSAPRPDTPATFPVPWDKSFPHDQEPTGPKPAHPLQRMVAERAITTLTAPKLGVRAAADAAHDTVVSCATDAELSEAISRAAELASA